MVKEKTPITQAIRLLKQHRVTFSPHLYNYEDKGGTSVSARELGVDEHQVIKTLVMEDDSRSPLIVLMHGDQEVSTKDLG
jgi:prolyl-tRNA editing enzyme YbaK/EbsC (Cys-tRNA(Pro) deacylase)